MSWKSWRLLKGFHVVDAVPCGWFWWQFDLVGGTGRWICGRYICLTADDLSRPNSCKTSLMNVVVGVAQVGASLLPDANIVLQCSAPLFLINLTFKHVTASLN